VGLETLRALANERYINKSSDDGSACANMGDALMVDGAIPVEDEYYPGNKSTRQILCDLSIGSRSKTLS